jgi:TolB-like protein
MPEAAQPLEPLPANNASLAVLPFTNMSGDDKQERLADGLTEDLITELARYRWLSVIARQSSFAYKGKALDARQVARELGVRYLLEGSLQTDPKRVRVTAQLIDATTGAHV